MTLFLIVTPILVVLLTVFSILIWRNGASGARAFSVATASVVVWLVGDYLARFGGFYELNRFGTVIKYCGVSAAPVTFFLLVGIYSRQRISAKASAWLFLVPMLTNLVALTNDYHNLFWKEITYIPNETPREVFGAYFWLVHVPYSYLFIGLVFYFLIRDIFSSSRFYRKQALFLGVGMIVPLCLNIFYLLGVTGRTSYTVLSFAVFTFFLGWGTLKRQLLPGSPIAYETVFRTIKDGVMVLDKDDLISDLNPAMEKRLGLKAAEVVGKDAKLVFCDYPALIEKYSGMAEGADEIAFKIGEKQKFLELNVTPLVNAKGGHIGRIISLRDISARKLQEQMLEDLAFQDHLTKLANRRYFQIESEKALDIARRGGGKLALLFLDLNKFKQVNDAYGHETGDELLKYVGIRAGARLRKPDVIARFGGDEFAILLHGADQSSVEEVVKRILGETSRPFLINGNSFDVRLSIGCALFPEDGSDLSELLRKADSRMYRSKLTGESVCFNDMLPPGQSPGQIGQAF